MKKRDKKKKKIHPFLKGLLIIFTIGSLVLFSMSSYFNIAEYNVSGNNYYSADEILSMGNCTKGDNIFWSGKVKDIKERLLKDPYVEEVKMRLALPDGVNISVKERRQVAAVVYGDSYIVLDGYGTALRKTEVEPKITVIKGLTLSKLKMGEVIEAEEKAMLEQSLELINCAEGNNMFFKKIKVSKKNMDLYIFDELLCEGNVSQVMEAMENNELQLVVKELLDREIVHGTISISGDGYISFTPEID